MCEFCQFNPNSLFARIPLSSISQTPYRRAIVEYKNELMTYSLAIPRTIEELVINLRCWNYIAVYKLPSHSRLNRQVSAEFSSSRVLRDSSQRLNSNCRFAQDHAPRFTGIRICAPPIPYCLTTTLRASDSWFHFTYYVYCSMIHSLEAVLSRLLLPLQSDFALVRDRAHIIYILSCANGFVRRRHISALPIR